MKATVTLSDFEDKTISATAYAREPDSKPKLDSSQVTGSASTYAKKYALENLLALDDTETDPDDGDGKTNQASDEQVKKINELITSTGRTEKAVLTWAKVSSIEEMTVDLAEKTIEKLSKTVTTPTKEKGNATKN